VGFKAAGVAGMIAAPVLLAGAGRKNVICTDRTNEKKAPAVPR